MSEKLIPILKFLSYLRNHLLREDIKNNRFGLGYLVNMARDNRNLMSRLDNLSLTGNIARNVAADVPVVRLIRKHVFWGVVKLLAGAKPRQNQLM